MARKVLGNPDIISRRFDKYQEPPEPHDSRDSFFEYSV